MDNTKEYCNLGKLVMNYFIEYINNENQKNYKKNFASYKDATLFKPIKPTQTELAKTLEMYGNNERLLKNNLSNYLRGLQPFPKELILQIANKLELNGSQFIELAKEYAFNHNLIEKEYHIESKNWFSRSNYETNNEYLQKQAKENIKSYFTNCITYYLIVEYLNSFCMDLLLSNYEIKNAVFSASSKDHLQKLANLIFGEEEKKEEI